MTLPTSVYGDKMVVRLACCSFRVSSDYYLVDNIGESYHESLKPMTVR